MNVVIENNISDIYKLVKQVNQIVEMISDGVIPKHMHGNLMDTIREKINDKLREIEDVSVR